MPGMGTRRQKAASPAGGEARSQSRRPSQKESRRTGGWEGRGSKTRLTDEKLLEERAVLQDLPETSISRNGAHRLAGGSLSPWHSGGHPRVPPQPPLPSPTFPSARLKPKPASSLGRGKAGASPNLQSERDPGVRLQLTKPKATKRLGRVTCPT